jgi:hypothetical protein
MTGFHFVWLPVSPHFKSNCQRPAKDFLETFLMFASASMAGILAALRIIETRGQRPEEIA